MMIGMAVTLKVPMTPSTGGAAYNRYNSQQSDLLSYQQVDSSKLCGCWGHISGLIKSIDQALNRDTLLTFLEATYIALKENQRCLQARRINYTE